MKKVLSLVLVIAMVLSSFSFAFAASFEDVVDTDYEKAIKTLVGLGVVTGYEDGTYRPERIVTRAEMAKLIVEILGYGDLVAGSASNFADTQGHWADAWIALAAGRGLVVGTGDGNFTPDRQVSYDEAITMIVRALGYTDDCNELKGMTWPTNFKVKAADLKLTKDVKLVGTGADRGGVAQLLFNALEANMVTVDTDGNVEYVKDGDDNKILLNALAKKNQFVVATKHLDEDHKEYKGDIVDLGPYMYQDIKVFENDDDEVVYVTKVESEVKVGEFRRSNANNDNEVNLRVDGKNKLYELDKPAATKVFYNGAEIELTEKQMEDGDSKVVDLHRAAVTFVFNDDDEIVGIVASKFTDAKKVENEYNGRVRFEGINLPLDDDDEVDYGKLTVIGEVDALEDIEEDDVIVLFASEGEKTPTADTEKLVIQVVRDTVEGKITRTNSDGEFYIDGKYYAASQFNKHPFEVGEEGIYFLDHQGRLVDFEEDDADTPKDYAVIVELLDGVMSESSNPRKLADAEITIVNAAGEEVTYKFDDKAKVDGEPVFANDNYLNISDDLDEYQVIKYTVNSKGKISKITIVADVDPEEESEKDITGKSYVFASNVVVFNLDSDGDVEVVDVDDLGDDVIILAQEKNKNGEIEMFFVSGLGAKSTYAYIVDDGTMWNDDDERVQSLIAYVDGVEVFYEADDLDVIDDDVIDTATIVKLHFNGDIVEDYTSEDEIDVKNKIAKTGTITRISGDRFQVDGDWYTLADDVAVYILDDGEFDEVGDESSIYRDAEVRVYAFDKDNIKDKVVEILFILEGAPERPVTPPVEPVTETYITYIDATVVEVDDVVYTLAAGTVLRNEVGVIEYTGGAAIDGFLNNGDQVFDIVANADNRISSFKYVAAEADRDAAQDVIDEIDALDSEAATFAADVTAAEGSYAGLTPAQKNLVTNHAELVAARATVDNADAVADVAAAKTALVADAAFLNGNADVDNITTNDLVLPTTDTNVSISWASSDSDVIDVTTVAGTGDVTQPSFTDGDATVTLTATITSDNVATVKDTKTFTLTVKALAESDAEKAARIKSDLVLVFATDDSATSVTDDITLLDETSTDPDLTDATSITWASNNTAVVANDGTVTRVTGTDVNVTLTATITVGGETVTKAFIVTVLGE